MDYPPQRQEVLEVDVIDILGLLTALVGVVFDAIYLFGDKELWFGIVTAVCLGGAALYGNYRRYQIAWLYWGLTVALVLIITGLI